MLLDTSFLLVMLDHHLDLDWLFRVTIPGQSRIVTVDRVLFELGRLARRGSSKSSRLASVALEVLRSKEIPVLDTPFGLPDVDTSLVAFSLAHRSPVMVATVDRRLRNLLASHHVPTVSPRGRSGLLISQASNPVRLK